MENIDIDALIQAPELFDTYLADIKARREANRANRLRSYWEEAIERLCAERASAIEDGDVEIAAELERTIAAFNLALGAGSGTLPAVQDDTASQGDEALQGDAPSPPSSSKLRMTRWRWQAMRTALHPPQWKRQHPEQLTSQAALDLPVPEVDEETQRVFAAAAAELVGRLNGHLDQKSAGLPREFAARALYCEGMDFCLSPYADPDDAEEVERLTGDSRSTPLGTTATFHLDIGVVTQISGLGFSAATNDA